MRIGIVGLGFVGHALASAAHESGHDVIGIEIDEERLGNLRDSEYSVSSSFSCLRDRQIIVIAVPTPLSETLEPDLSFLISACTSVRDESSEGTLIINESTSFPGTLRNLIAPLFGDGFLFASAPERVDPGNKTWDIHNTPRLVAGLSEEATKLSSRFYRSICHEVIEVSSPEVAESAKLFENTFRQVNIALVNEFAQIASSLGLSAFEILDAAATKPYGFMQFLPSVGVGGHCIPIDPSYLSFAAEMRGFNARFIKLANEVNRGMPKFIAAEIDKRFGVAGKNIQVVGITYKPGVSDTRESPAIALISALRELDANVTWFDPLVPEFAGEFSSKISSVDIGIICTANPEVDYSSWNCGTKVIDLSTSRDLEWPKFL